MGTPSGVSWGRKDGPARFGLLDDVSWLVLFVCVEDHQFHIILVKLFMETTCPVWHVYFRPLFHLIRFQNTLSLLGCVILDVYINSS